MFAQILSLLLTLPGGSCPGDVNSSGSVNVDDLLALIADWGCADDVATTALQLDGVNGTRLRQTTEIEIGVGQTFEVFAWSALLRVDDPSRQGATILAKRTAASVNEYPLSWRLNRWQQAGDSTGDPDNHKRISFVLYDAVDVSATHYGDADGLGAGVTPQLAVGSFVPVGGWVNYAQIAANVLPVSAFTNGVEYPLTTDDVISSILDSNVVLSIGGIMGAPTTNQAEFTLRDLAIWSVKPPAGFWAGFSGLTMPGTYQSALRYHGQGLRHFYPLDNLMTGLLDRVGGNHLIADGGVTVVSGPSGVENMSLYPVTPTTGVCRDCTINSGTPTTNINPTAVNMSINGSSGNAAAFSLPALASNIPAGSTIDPSSTLTLTTSATAAAPAFLTLKMVNIDTDGIAENAITWNSYVGAGLFATTINIDTDVTTLVFTGAGLAAMLQRATDARFERPGFVLMDQSGEAVTLSVRAGENATAGIRPAWSIAHTPAAAGGGGQTKILPLLINGVI